jgi:pimeloyl-ACP methyl ester carboxylesterase
MTSFAFLHGLLSDRIVWEPLAESLGGESFHADLTSQSSITGMAESVLAETEGDLIVIGHSMGGRVAMETARLAPKRVKALVLANTGHHPLATGEREIRQSKIDEGYGDFEKLAAEWLRPMVAPDRLADTVLMTNLMNMVLRQSPEIHERQITALIDRPNAALFLPHTTCPILLVTGENDSWAPEPQHREMAELAPDAEFHLIVGAGHFLPLEQPVKLTAIVQDWLARHREAIGD